MTPSSPTPILCLVADYLALRRASGFELTHEEGQLKAFARFADQPPHTAKITTGLALAWAQASHGGRQITAARRVEVLRPFMKYCVSVGLASEIVPPNACGPAHRRLAPHIYSETEICDLIRTAGELPPEGGLRRSTYAAFFGLLAVTGMRLSEALGLDRGDVSYERSLLTIRQTKFRKSRFVPIHPSTVAALQAYEANCALHVPSQQSPAFFVTQAGDRLPARAVQNTFAALRQRLGWRARGAHARPRLHDLRHTFICRAANNSDQRPSGLDSLADAIATYVGHAKVSDTYWYLSATPDLMAAASERFAAFVKGGER